MLEDIEPIAEEPTEKKGLSPEAKAAKFQEILERASRIKSDQSAVKTMFQQLSNMYWIEDSVNINSSAWDTNDIRYTKSPNARNAVTGIHNMLKTSKPQFSVKCSSKEYSNRIESALKKWWDVSSERKISPVESELVLSAALFTDCNVSVTAIDDLLNMDDLKPVRRRRLEDRKRQTAFYFEAEPAMISYPVWGDDGLSEFLQCYKMRGKQIKERWGEVPNVKDEGIYTVNDYWEWEFRCLWLDENIKEPIIIDEHGLIDMPRFSAVANGTEQFETLNYGGENPTGQTSNQINPMYGGDHKRQPFLYGIWKSGLSQREDEALTALFTSMYSRGSGPLTLIDPSTPNFDANKITVKYDGPFRYIIAKGQVVDDKAYDTNILTLLNKLDEMGQRSTVNAQTLGENIESGTPYSGYAMASQNGRIPLVAIQQAVEKVIKDASMYALRQFKASGMKWEGLKANEIPDDLELTVKLEVDLPQDAFRNAQVAGQLDGKVSDEWLHELLGVKDSKKMTFDIMSEQATKAAFQQNLPNLVQEMLRTFTPPPPPESTPSTTPPSGGDGVSPEGMTPPNQVSVPGGAQAAAAGGQVIPATEPLPVTKGVA